jgi:hypothetical protein
MDSYRVAIAPDQLWQAINPWTFNNSGQWGLINISLGSTTRPDIEQKVLDEVGSYGRQLGRIGDALEVLIAHFDKKDLTQNERDALSTLTGQLAEVRAIKRRSGRA